ncbi:peptide chain release factor 2 [Halodesulfovibrio sp.]|uniref:peptide chain release factor 2 n=1 Tax=Halodesulfovibrio sp. TaxID=1912772 RepID=UPI0025E89AC5|nr:peptide chain release factor 2 [Halodesulfovibrio sp.]MCT4627923.1 peptide chain release factor 2 [Halodesulfovibrio sp.]
MLQLADLRTKSIALTEQFNSLWRRLDLKGNKDRLDEIEKQLASPGAWDNPDKLTPVLQEKSQLEGQIDRLQTLMQANDDLAEWLALAEEDQSTEVLETLSAQTLLLEELLEQTELNLLLSAPEDRNNAILEIHPGAGGTEAQDWAKMLLRMYVRWADRHKFKVEYLDLLDGDEAGIKSVTLRIKGENAYGFLKGEKGIHRLIRISPFDSSGRRHTSFASIDIIPDAGKDITVDIQEGDLRIDVFRSSGPGGQSVNTTSSAVRITHIPTGVTAQCQNEKSQHANKDTALQILKSRLYEIELRKVQDERQAAYAGKMDISFGSQIRTYTLQPYRLVKDHRTNSEIGDVDSVLDGKLDQFLRDFLLYLHAEKTT